MLFLNYFRNAFKNKKEIVIKVVENKKKYLSVSEIAKEANVSRNLVWSYIRKHKIEPASKKGKKFKFDSEIVSKIKKKQDKKQSQNNDKVGDYAISESVLEIFKKQLEEKDKQIEKLQDNLKFAQLAAVDSKKKQDEQAKLIEHHETNYDELKQENEDLKKQLEELKDRGFWDRLFNK